MPSRSSQSHIFYLRSEDRILWETIAKTVAPLSGRPRKKAEVEDFDLWVQEMGGQKLNLSPEKLATSVSQQKLVNTPKAKPPSANIIHPLDRPTHRKIAKGQLDIDARIDLHGLTQREAHELLYGFLVSAHARGLRHVLVITGKGRSTGGDGILRQAVPHWFSTPIFRILVGAFEDAAHHHGGHGALYVRLRRPIVRDKQL
ncbi:DNA mismatch repair protein MutS [Paraburkholderia aspalathi]|nr:DNA mismatch repair protein MutS [Paraburkholderia aspalathi]